MKPFKKYLIENRSEFGCLMVMFTEQQKQSLISHGKKLVSDDILYMPNDPEYGRCKDPHVTIMYGFDKDLTDEQLMEIFKEVKPFNVKLTGISMFKNDKCDVVKYDVESQDLHKLNKKCREYGHDKWDVYDPHSTIAYVNKDSINIDKKFSSPITLRVKDIVYSGLDKKKRSFTLV